MRPDEPRLAKLDAGTLTEPQREVYAAIAGGRRARGPQLFRLVDDDGRLEGPFNAFLLQPRLGGPLQALGAAIRYDGSLTDRQREIAILVVAAHWDSAFEWHSHEVLGRHAGLTDHEIDAIRAGHAGGLDGPLNADERAVAKTARLLVAEGDLDDTAYGQVIEALGEAGLFELMTLVGYYATLALQLRVFRVQTPDS